MSHFYVAWKYLAYNKARAATLIGCVALLAFLPLALDQLLDESERQLAQRAQSTPLLLGAKGSALDLVMNSIYFGDQTPEPITMSAHDRIRSSELARPIPLYVSFKARGFPIVGTTLDYFEVRNLHVASGRTMVWLGECMVGATAAAELDLAPGDFVVSSPENLFDLAGIYPLKMKVAGILNQSQLPDDRAIFVDVKTAWIIQGLGHGHQDLAEVNDPTLVLNRTDSSVTASAKLFHYNEITPENMGSFHFHGDQDRFPITAVMVMPNDDKSSALLQGRFLSKDEPYLLTRPQAVIDQLLQNIFKIKSVLDAILIVVSVATAAALVLVFALSWRLRKREWDTIFKIGCRPSTMVRLIGAEIGLILLAAAGLCATGLVVLQSTSTDLVRMFFVG
jgi:putative ABC transport system permease protein